MNTVKLTGAEEPIQIQKTINEYIRKKTFGSKKTKTQFSENEPKVEATLTS
jgi:hypothetical protein